MAEANFKNKTFFEGDNLDIMRGINSECIDLIYLDPPPVNKKKDFTAPMGARAEGASFKDTFTQEDLKEEWVQDIKETHPEIHTLLEAVRTLEGQTSYNFCYLAYMAIRLIECRRILKDTGSIYLHCDPTMSHYLKWLMDCIFGEDNFRNEIVWSYHAGSWVSKRDFPRRHDIILRYAKSSDFVFNTKKEVLTRKEILSKFSIARIQKHPAIFDADKLKWVNKQYIKKLNRRQFADAVAPFLERPANEGGLPDRVARPVDREYVAKLADCARERLEVLSDMARQMAFFFVETPDYDAELLLGKGTTTTETKQVLNATRARLNDIPNTDFNASRLEASLRQVSAELNLKSGKVFHPLRIAMTGSKIAPPLFETIALIGKERALLRIDRAIAKLN